MTRKKRKIQSSHLAESVPDPSPALVYGESAALILDVLAGANRGIDDDGMHTFEFHLEPEVGKPLVRAAMRAEAELLLADADSNAGEPNWRTPDQRRADAMMAVVGAASDVLNL